MHRAGSKSEKRAYSVAPACALHPVTFRLRASILASTTLRRSDRLSERAARAHRSFPAHSDVRKGWLGYSLCGGSRRERRCAATHCAHRTYLGGRDFTFSYAAVAISGALGLGPGIVATLLCVAGVDYFFLTPSDQIAISSTADFLSLTVFMLVALLISGLASRLRRAGLVAEEKCEEAERLTGELGEQASALADQAQELEDKAVELARAEALNRAIVESYGEPMVVHDSEWRFQYINEPAMRIFKTSSHHLPESLIGEKVWDLYPDIVDHPFGINLTRSMDERTPVSFEAHYPESGQWSEVTCYPLPNGGLVTVWKNVTARHQDEEARRCLSEASALLGKSLDYENTLSALARMVIPDLADWCRVDMLQDDGTMELLRKRRSRSCSIS